MAELKDSGARQSFGTGAVRDIQEGKGRCDLLPLSEVAHFLKVCDPISVHPDPILIYLHAWTKSPEETKFLYWALREAADTMFVTPHHMLLEVSIHFEDGARKYGDNNWRKGIPATRYLDSAIRHYLKWLRGDNDEPHHRAFCWNILCMIWELNNHDQSMYEEPEAI